MNIIKIINEEIRKSIKQYIGQCNVLRGKCTDNEKYWQDMVKNKRPIPFNVFIKNVDIYAILDEGETPQTYIKELLISDPSTKSYISTWGNDEAMFLETHGFEFIFV